MSRTKCSNCGLVNLVADQACRRCGCDPTADVLPGKPGIIDVKPAGRSISPYVVIAVVLCVIAFTAFGIRRAVNRASEIDKKRIEAEMRSRKGIENEWPDQMKKIAANDPVVDQQKQIEIIRRAMHPDLDVAQKEKERLKQFANQGK